jgi:hypothetical protein
MCRYVSDQQLFRELDHWQHPCTFEQVQRGDCEDYALWAWRQLLQLGYDADFVVGRQVDRSPEGTVRPHGARHAWVLFRQNGEEYLYEPAMKDRTKAVRPLQTSVRRTPLLQSISWRSSGGGRPSGLDDRHGTDSSTFLEDGVRWVP